MSLLSSPLGRRAAALVALGAVLAAPAAAQLYDNGPIATGPRPAGGQLSVVQTGLGMTLIGTSGSATAPAPGPFRLADNFAIPTGQTWSITSVRVFGYQTGSTTTSTFTAGTLQIWNGRPGDVGSTVVFGNATTNRLSATAFSSIYRVLDTDLTASNRPIMSIDLGTAGLSLGSGNYWVDFSLTGSLASGPFVPPVTRLGQTSSATPGTPARQFAAGGTPPAWSDVVDAGVGQTQDVPFQVFGTVVTSTVPEPSTYALMATGLVGLALVARRRR